MTTDQNGDPGGLGLALGFIAASALTLWWVPGYLDATEGWRAFWLATGGVLGLIGAGGAGIELARLRGVEGYAYVSAGLVLAGLGGVLHVLQATTIGGRPGSVLKVAVVALLLFAPTGIGMGVARVLLEPRPAPSDRQGVTAKLVTLVAGLVGLATAVLNFVSATQG